MDGPIIPRSIVIELAKRVADAGVLLQPHAHRRPVGTAAGQMFQAELLAQQALRAAFCRVQEGTHG